MLKRFTLLFAILALAASAATTYKVTLLQPSVVKGKALKAGEYRLDVADAIVTITSGKQSIEVPVKIENADAKFSATSVRYTADGGKQSIAEIRLGGTTTKLVFNP